MPKLSYDIFAVPDGEIHPKMFRAGDDVTGQVAAAAADQGKIAMDDTPRKRGRPPKNKAMTAPENK